MQVTPLQSTSLAELEPILEEELSCWKEQLHWDYRPAVDLIRRHVAARLLPGFILTDSSGVSIGYGYCLVDVPIGYVGNVFVRNQAANQETYGLVIEALLNKLHQNPRIRRIEGQIFPFNFDLRAIFERTGMTLIERRYMQLDLASVLGTEVPPLAGYSVEGWDACWLNKAARLIFLSYQNSPDLTLCADYQTVHGCRRFLSNLVIGPGCGTFSPGRSRIVLNSQGDLVALLLTTRISKDSLMIPQISVHPKHQRRGLGTFLLQSLLRQTPAPIRRVILSVSCPNQGAFQLYERLGYQSIRDFLGIVHDPPGR